MKKIILLFGDLATGKSTLSNILANRYHCLLINKDNIKEILYNIGEVIDMDEKKINEQLISLKKRNNLNNMIIIILLVILLAVCAVAVYVRVA